MNRSSDIVCVIESMVEQHFLHMEKMGPELRPFLHDCFLSVSTLDYHTEESRDCNNRQLAWLIFTKLIINKIIYGILCRDNRYFISLDYDNQHSYFIIQLYTCTVSFVNK